MMEIEQLSKIMQETGSWEQAVRDFRLTRS